jgi:hypothetical protein
LLQVRAPKPTLLTFTSRDQYLPLQGAREAYWETQEAYEAFGKKDNIQLVEDDDRHAMTPKIRKAIYGFFMEHFGLHGDAAEVYVELLAPEELQVTPTGQVSTSLNSNGIFDVNKEETIKRIKNLENSRKNISNHLATVLQKAKSISGYKAPTDEAMAPFINGRYQRDGYIIEKYAIRGEGYYAIPMLLFIPDNSGRKYPAVVFIHPEGKAIEAQPGGEIEKLVRKGYVVAAIDVLGTGELKDNTSRGMAIGYTGVLIGRSLPGLQAGNIARVTKYLKTRPEVDGKNIGAVGMGGMCIPLIHAAAFNEDIKNVVLIDPLISYRSVAMNRFFRVGLTEREKVNNGHPFEVDFDWGITGVLTGYDLPDLIATVAPRKVAMVNLRDQMLEPAPEQLVKQEMNFPKLAYASKNASGNLKILSQFASIGPLVEWCFSDADILINSEQTKILKEK